MDLVLLAEDSDRFVVNLDRGQVTCPRMPLKQVGGHEDLANLVRREAKHQLDLEVCYLGLLEVEDIGSSPVLVAAATVQHIPEGSRLRSLSLTDIAARGWDVQHHGFFETAYRWREADLSAKDLSNDIHRAFRTAVALLSRKRAAETGRWGWEQYLQSDSIGVLSTANGVLACAHAGAGYELLDEPIATLEEFQDTAGGWPIRRSLVGSSSDAPITESTSMCLWAFHETKRGTTSDPVRRGIAWLEQAQRADGGWPSAAADDRSLVYPTALAVRVLARFERTDAVARGLTWLRDAQCGDGGWGAMASLPDEEASSSPAYTAAAIIALSHGGVSPDDDVIKTGCAYLLRTFHPERPEPWESTSFTTLVDPSSHARMEFRHFATPCVLSALCQAGYDLGHPVVLTATRQLLRLQQPGGAWRCVLVAPNTTPIWAIHGAVEALRVVLDASGRNLAPLVRDQYSQAERQSLAKLAGSLLANNERPRDLGRPRRGWLSTMWLSVLTVAVALLVLGQTGVLEKLQSSSGLSQIGAAAATFLVTSIGAVAPTIITEKYWIRRSRGQEGTREQE